MYTEHVSTETSLIHITQAKLTDSQKTHSQKETGLNHYISDQNQKQILSCKSYLNFQFVKISDRVSGG